MSKFSKFGATALAMALSLTLVAPITANAQVLWKKEGTDRVYTNEDTKKSLSKEKNNVDLMQAEDLLRTEEKVHYISVNAKNQTVQLATTQDVAKFENFKGKKGLKVKVIFKSEYADPKSAAEKEVINEDYTENGAGYYKNHKGDFVKIDENAPKGMDYGLYTIRLFAKKAGNYKLTYDAKLKDGSTVKKSLKVVAREDSAAIKSVTYAGKVISETTDVDAPSNNKLWKKSYGENTTTVKKGTIKVVVNKDFKLKKVEVGTPRLKSATNDEGKTRYGYEEATSELDEADVRDVDAYAEDEADRPGRPPEGEGPNMDFLNLSYKGVQDMPTYSWKKVKNGKKIKLSKVDEAKAGMVTLAGDSFYAKDVQTKTVIRVTVYDKKNKITKRFYYNIFLAR
ncbi:hypothetical protein [Butyrivibrio sp. XPD2002]|uniref:hypothetical protein n=1 Tax=Butyrivibrio sp. XPD2002 TaxID=1280665 RepID=UPI0004288698|nr:hypothetical protein [Butyrivibrio sp. XPD2002]